MVDRNVAERRAVVLQANGMEGGVRGVPIPQNRTEIRVNIAQNNIRKLQTALKLPTNF